MFAAMFLTGIPVAPGFALTAERGAVVPVYLSPATLAEAGAPSANPIAFVDPGTELLYGYAVQDLQHYLQRMTGAEFPFQPVDGKSDKGLFVGLLSEFPAFKSNPAFSSANPEAFVIEAQGQRFYILGNTRWGLMAAIYTFLDALGCKWYAPGEIWENVPNLKSLKFDSRLNRISSGPSFQSRFLSPGYGFDYPIARIADKKQGPEWMRRNRFGGINYVCNWHNLNVIPPELFKTRPELFALVNGQRNEREIARANPETVRLAVSNVLAFFDKNAGKGSFIESYSVEPGDGFPMCEESLAKIGNHTHTDLAFWFANQVAEGIEKAGRKDKWIGILDYSGHSGIPTFNIHSQVAVSVCTALVDASLTTEQRLDALRALQCRRLGIYDYLVEVNWSLEKPGASGMAHPRGFAPMIRSYYEHGARDYTTETADSWINGGVGHYLMGRLLWDVRVDVEKEIEDYYRGAFGPAAKPVRALYENWEQTPRISLRTCTGWYRQITAASKLAQGRHPYQERINIIKRYYLYLNLLREMELSGSDPALPAWEARFDKLLRYVAASRGEHAFHASWLLMTLIDAAKATFLVDPAGIAPEILAARDANWDEKAWAPFPPIPDAEIDRLFDAVNPESSVSQAICPVIKLFPENAAPPANLVFPKVSGAVGVPREYVLNVVAPVPKLTLTILSSGYSGGDHIEARTCTVEDSLGNVLKRLAFKTEDHAVIELANVKPGIYVVSFPEYSGEQVTVTGGHTFGAVRSHNLNGGFNSYHPSASGEDKVRWYFLISSNQNSIRVGLLTGMLSIGFVEGQPILPEMIGFTNRRRNESPEAYSERLNNRDKQLEAQTVTFAPASQSRIACVQWLPPDKEVGNGNYSEWMVVKESALFSPDPSYVLYETMQP